MAKSRSVVIVGTLDTKGQELGYLRDCLAARGAATLVVDAGVLDTPDFVPDVDRYTVAAAAGMRLDDLVQTADRGQAVAAMAAGAARVVADLFAQGKVAGVIGIGGSGNATIACAAMRALPIGVPKLMLTTLAAGDTRPFVGSADIAMMYSVVDIAGLNRFSRRILANAAAAVAGMAAAFQPVDVTDEVRPLLGATMFGVTTPCVTAARQTLEELGYEVLVFHATGVGGRSLEALVRDGFITGVLDVTTTELADEIAGGALSAGPERLDAAGLAGIPQVVSLGALDMANFGPLESVPERFRTRQLYQHNPAVTLMRTTPEENAKVGELIATKLNRACGPVALFVPRGGVSAISVPGGVFHDPDADAALFAALRGALAAHVELIEMEVHINDPAFAQAMATKLHQLYVRWKEGEGDGITS